MRTLGLRAAWPQSCGKTQLASYLAGALWRSWGVDFLGWVNAGSRASVLSGYAAAAAQLGLDHGGGAESVAARFAAWLAGTARPWLVVLDDLRDAADLNGLWPAGPAGRLLVTAAGSEVIPSGQAVTVPVSVFTQREAMGYLFDRLTTHPDQRSGAYDLVAGLGGEPTALAQASAVMAGSGTGVVITSGTSPSSGLRRSASRPPQRSPGLLSADYAEELLPGGGTWPLLVLAALLDSHGIPPAVLTAPAVPVDLPTLGTRPGCGRSRTGSCPRGWDAARQRIRRSARARRRWHREGHEPGRHPHPRQTPAVPDQHRHRRFTARALATSRSHAA